MANFEQDDIVIGKKRPHDNPLIVPYEVGKGRKFGSPKDSAPDFTYGAPSKRDPEGAGQVVLNWVEHQSSRKSPELTTKDFVRMNKKGVTERCVTSKDVGEFRKAHVVKVQKSTLQRSGKGAAPGVTDATVFGAPTKSDISVKDLMNNRFALEWVREQQKIAQASDSREAAKMKASKSQGKRLFMHPPANLTPEPEPVPFMIRKFQNVPSKVAERLAAEGVPSPLSGSGRVVLPPIHNTAHTAAEHGADYYYDG
eukprot:TRINITY_DN9887_c0_g1_i1.p1 TRINITY_DN9887_c0_g1~~TRINITY_DN9887_c0_g1_i1.p1  ORF type:complete len:274 (+),score=115.10 TRINITY_DN9887_c0_g1_i1:62-823(+)